MQFEGAGGLIVSLKGIWLYLVSEEKNETETNLVTKYIRPSE